MSCTLGLWIGESFAEIRGFSKKSESESAEPASSQRPLIEQRWFLPKKSLTDGLKEALRALNAPHSGTIRISSSRAKLSLARKHGPSLAFLVTEGFENWIQLHSSPLSIPRDHIFGISERALANGQIEAPLKLDELEFLVTKLELLNIKDIAIGYLNSHLNPENEERTAHFFKERGFRVVMSHQLSPSQNEMDRWVRTLECAYTAASVEEELKSIEDTLQASLGEDAQDWKLEIWGDQGLSPLSDRNFHGIQFGIERALAENFMSSPHSTILYFGLEQFLILRNQDDENSDGRPRVEALPIQPTQKIMSGEWLAPKFGSGDHGYEPGPMSFGKSHHLALLDILFLNGRLSEVEAVSNNLNDRGRSRIIEALFTLGKDIPSSRGIIDAHEVAADLELACIERINSVLTLGQHSPPSQSGSARRSILLSGPYAKAFQSLLSRRRPDLDFEMDRDADWIQSRAAAGRF